MENLNIKELISSVRNELIESQNEREANEIAPLFYVDNLKIEVNFVVEKKKNTNAGFDLKVIDVGRDVSKTDKSIHKITLELKTLASNNVSSQDGNSSSGEGRGKQFPNSNPYTENVDIMNIPGVNPIVLPNLGNLPDTATK